MRQQNSTRAILMFAALVVGCVLSTIPSESAAQTGLQQQINNQGQASGPQQRPSAQGPQQQPPQQMQAPFSLDEQEFNYLYSVLAKWEERSAQIKTAKANFTLWTDDPVFQKQTTKQGKVSYKAPDHGLYKVLGEDGEWVDHWVCDGKSIYDYDYKTKKMTQFTLPPGLQGQNIAQGPLPFLFAAKKDDLLRRYWMRVIPSPKEKADQQIWIEAYPRTQNERANFLRATIILTRMELLPYAIELYFDNNSRTVHQFDWKINSGNPLGIFLPNEFEASLPRGWSKVVDPQMQETRGNLSTAGASGTIRQE